MDEDDFSDEWGTDSDFTGEWRRAPMSRGWALLVLLAFGAMIALAMIEAFTR